MTYIKNLLHKIEDLSIGYHLPKFHILCQNSYGIETIIMLILVPLRVDPLLSGRRHSSGSEAPPKGLTPVNLISGGGGGGGE